MWWLRLPALVIASGLLCLGAFQLLNDPDERDVLGGAALAGAFLVLGAWIAHELGNGDDT